MTRFEAMTIPHALGICDGCYDELAVERDATGGGYCAACRELNRQIDERYERRLLRLAEEEEAAKVEAAKLEALEHAGRAARLYGSLPRIDGRMPEATRRGPMALARRVWNAIF